LDTVAVLETVDVELDTVAVLETLDVELDEVPARDPLELGLDVAEALDAATALEALELLLDAVEPLASFESALEEAGVLAQCVCGRSLRWSRLSNALASLTQPELADSAAGGVPASSRTMTTRAPPANIATAFFSGDQTNDMNPPSTAATPLSGMAPMNAIVQGDGSQTPSDNGLRTVTPRPLDESLPLRTCILQTGFADRSV
jgi:hypothetical protein